jgi:hypothetical protein
MSSIKLTGVLVTGKTFRYRSLTPSGNSAATDVQCFQYDYLGRMTQAWAPGTATCAVTPSASAEGGAAPYWESYGYAVTGDMTGITSTTPPPGRSPLPPTPTPPRGPPSRTGSAPRSG